MMTGNRNRYSVSLARPGPISALAGWDWIIRVVSHFGAGERNRVNTWTRYREGECHKLQLGLFKLSRQLPKLESEEHIDQQPVPRVTYKCTSESY